MPAATTTLPTLLAAVTALENAARYDEALALVDSTRVTDGADRLALLMARASVVARRDYVRGAPSGADHPLDAAHELAAAIGTGPTTSWDLAMLQLRRQYADQLVSGLGPAGRDPRVVDEMTAEAARLRDTAPDDGRRGWALMGLGWFSDNLRGDRVEAPAHYRAALALGRRVDDPLLVFEAQRHLGDHAHDDGDHAGATAAWEESAAAAARVGHVLGVLAQLLLLAVLARDAGDEAGARVLATETGRWAGELAPHGWSSRCAGSWPASTPPARPRTSPPPRDETGVPYAGTAGQRDAARPGERLPWLHAPGPPRTHATRRLTRPPAAVSASPLVAERDRGVFCWSRSTAEIEEERDPIG